MPTKKFWDSSPTEDAVVAGPGRVGGMKDAERIRQAEDGEVVEIATTRADSELDLAVALAIGVETAVAHNGRVFITSRERDEIRGIEHTTCEGNVACIPFQPSTDLNAAFMAAEKAGIFDHPDVTVSRNEKGQWEVEKRIGLRDCETLAIQPTLALAICTAILKLKEETPAP